MRASEIKRSILSDYLSQRLVFTLHFALGRQFGPNNLKKIFSHLLQISCYVVTFRQCVLLGGDFLQCGPARWPPSPCCCQNSPSSSAKIVTKIFISKDYFPTYIYSYICPLVKLMHFYTQSNANISYVRMVFSFVFLFVWAMICQKPFVLLSQSHCHYCRVPERDRWK